ncbi:MAG: YbbR-like domain-containing protein [Bacteroidales bacterium]|jgi:hypothetical protein|nr:YbbR-like domain-containing protein [Bacteroidales bacterium]
MDIKNLLFRDKNIDAKQKKRLRHRLLAFTVCLVISFSLWLLLSYSQKGNEYFSIGVRGKNPPKGFLLSDQSTKIVSFQTRASVQSIENIKRKGKKEHIIIDLNKIVPEHRRNEYTVTLAVESYLEDYLRQIGYNGKFENLSPDSVTFIIERGERKEVPVQVDVQYAIPDQYRRFSPPVIEPATIFVEGKKSAIDTITHVRTKRSELGNAQDTIDVMLALHSLSYARFSTDSIRFIVPLGEVTEKNISVPIVPDFSDSALEIKLIPDQVTISCLVPIKRFSDITPDMFEIIAEFDSSAMQNGNILQLKAQRFPETVEITRIIPETASYILVEK